MSYAYPASGASSVQPHAARRVTGSGGSSKTVTIRAYSTPCNDGVRATMELWVNGSKKQTWTNVASSWTTYSKNVTLSGNDQIEIVFTNDCNAGGYDRNLYVDYVIVNGHTLQAEEGAAIIDKGAGSAAFDGRNVIAGQQNICWNAALRFVVGPQAYAACYDPNGNMTCRLRDGAAQLLTYDAENRLTEVTASGETTFFYDGDGTRVKQSNRFGTTVYVGNLYERFVAQEAIIGEVGLLNDTLTHSPQEITFSRPYANPVVFAQSLSYDGSDTSVVRITDVQTDRFTLYVDEAPNKDGAHTTESVSWVVLEAGRWKLADGTLLEVGLVDTGATVGSRVSNVWEAVAFNLPFSAAPVVASQVQTEHDAAWVKTRQRDSSATGFEVALEPADSQTTAHDSERIGWLAIEAGSGTWNGHKYEAGKTSNAVTHNWYQISFGQSFGAAPRFIAALATYDGSDGAALRYDRASLDSNRVEVKVEEDTTYDSETSHTTEVVDYVAVQGSGDLTAKAYVTGAADVSKHYYAASQRVAVRDDGTLRWVLTDHLGSTAVTAEANGTKHGELRYEAFGETRYAWGDTPTSYRYTGQREDGIIGLYFYNARYYDAALGRFVQADTVVPNPADPQSFNRYSYVRNNPLKYVDPSGHDDNPFDVGGYGSGGGGGGGEAIGLLVRLLLEVLISSLMPDLPGPAEAITLTEPSTAARNREIAESVDQTGQAASLVKMAATVTIVGTPDADHEKAQVKRFGQLVGGGEMEFFGDAQPGVEGEFTPTGSNESFPLSLKDFTQTGKMGNVIGRINDNANKVANAGYAGNAVLHAETTQWNAETFMNFVEGGPIKNMPFEGVFERLYFNCSDGIVVVDGSGVSIID